MPCIALLLLQVFEGNLLPSAGWPQPGVLLLEPPSALTAGMPA